MIRLQEQLSPISTVSDQTDRYRTDTIGKEIENARGAVGDKGLVVFIAYRIDDADGYNDNGHPTWISGPQFRSEGVKDSACKKSIRRQMSEFVNIGNIRQRKTVAGDT